MTGDACKEQARHAIRLAMPTLSALSGDLHREVELAFHEFKAQRWLCDALSATGFLLEEGLGSVQTAFRARKSGARPGPRIAFLCEYDGLPVYGQSCGHNVVAAAAVGAAIGMASVLDRLGGEIIVLGTPGEEGGGGKTILHREGFFDGLDAMMLIYPGMDNIAHSRSLEVSRAEVEFFGKAAHAAARPELGINALDAMLAALSAIALLRQQLPSDVRIHSIITKGGTLPQVIPDHTSAILTLRANDRATVDQVIPRLDACLAGAALGSGTRLTHQWRHAARALFSNATLAGCFEANLRALGRPTRGRDELSGAWSGDTGHVSWFVPTIQPQMAMTGRDVPPHSHEFHQASTGPAADACILDAAQAMAMTAIDLMLDDGLLHRIRQDFAAGHA